MQSFSSGNIVLSVSKASPDKGRNSFLISTKISKKAVERNKLKRQLKEVFRKKGGEAIKKRNALIMVKKNEKKDVHAKALKNDLEKALEQTQIFYK